MEHLSENYTNVKRRNKKREKMPTMISDTYYCLFVCCKFILLLRESDQCVIRARLGVASHLSTTPRWRNPAKCPSQRHNK